jgi:hypothetical protein
MPSTLAVKPDTARPTAGEKTGPQQRVIASIGASTSEDRAASYEVYREMRKHPTLALARALSIAPVVSADWSVVADKDVPKDIAKWIADQFMPIRQPLVETALCGSVDYGHQGWEKVFVLRDGRVTLKKLKPLLQDITYILVTKKTGAFAGFLQKAMNEPLPLANSLLIPFRVEGTQWDGQPLMENARLTWLDWKTCNKGAAKYDEKIAGCKVVIEYPSGESKDASGNLVDNADLALTIAAAMKASGDIIIPRSVAVNMAEGDNADWVVRILADGSGQQPTFIPRLQYLDIQMARALLLPERSVMQGQHGTMAEAGEHIDLALTHADLQHEHITRMINWHCVDQLLAVNFGQRYRGKVRLVAAPIRDAKLAFFRTVYQAVLANPSGFLQEFDSIDRESLKDALGVPKIHEVTAAPTAEPLPGVDTNEPLAASVRRLFASMAPGIEPSIVGDGVLEEGPAEPELTSPATPAPRPPEPDYINPLRMNDVQLGRAQSIVKQVLRKEITREVGVAWLITMFGWPRKLANQYMGSAGKKPRQSGKLKVESGEQDGRESSGPGESPGKAAGPAPE